jgi:hypothetical protein
VLQVLLVLELFPGIASSWQSVCAKKRLGNENCAAEKFRKAGYWLAFGRYLEI